MSVMTREAVARINDLLLAEIYYRQMAEGKLPPVKKCKPAMAVGAYRGGQVMAQYVRNVCRV
jgi:hypothetical protein